MERALEDLMIRAEQGRTQSARQAAGGSGVLRQLPPAGARRMAISPVESPDGKRAPRSFAAPAAHAAFPPPTNHLESAMKKLFSLTLLAAFALSTHAADAPDTLAKIKSSKSITLAYAQNAAPFSFDDTKAFKPAGYSISLCEGIVAQIQRQLGLDALKINWVAGTTPERLALVAEGKADMECGVTTNTLKRQEKVDFSITTFVQTGALLVRADSGVKKAADLAGKKISVVAGTTTQKRVTEALANARIAAEVLPFKDREDAFKALEEGKAQALAGDRIVLVGLVARDTSQTRYALLDEDFSLEPYAFALRRGDPDFRLAVNRALAVTYRSGAIASIFERWFAPFKPSDVLVAVYGLNSMEE
jgi:glutamate/aspartate transport system substrate-binding protein